MTAGSAEEAPPEHPSRIRIAVQALIAVGVIAAIFGWGIPRITGGSYGDIFAHLGELAPWEILVLVGIAFASLVAYGPFLAASLPRLGVPQAVVANLASTAVANTVPGGGAFGVAVSVGMYASWGFAAGPITRSILVTGFWNLFAKLALPVLAVSFMAVAGSAAADYVVWAGVGVLFLAGSVGVFVVVLWSDRFARMLGDLAGRVVSGLRRLLRRPPVVGWGVAAVDFRQRSIGLVRSAWVPLTVWIVVFNLAMFLVLLMCVRFLGVSEADLPWVTVFAGYAFSRLISSVPVTPGGVGLVEAGLLGLLAAGLPMETKLEVAAAALMFRGLTFLLPIPLGALSAGVWATRSKWRREAT